MSSTPAPSVAAPAEEDDRLVAIGPLIANRGDDGGPPDYHFDVLYCDGEMERMTWLRAPSKGAGLDRAAKREAGYQRNLMARDHRATVVFLHDLTSFDSLVRFVRQRLAYTGPATPAVVILGR